MLTRKWAPETGASRLFFHLLFGVLGDDFLSHLPRHFLVMIESLSVNTAPLRHRSEGRRVAIELLEGDECLDYLVGPVGIHPENLPSPSRNIPHNITHIIFRHGNLDLVNRFQEDRLRLLEPLLESHPAGNL